jgi:iron complex transport system ATP-binding protein
MLRVEGLYSGYGGGDIVNGISLSAGRGETLCVVGPNGCGKSTLLKTLINALPYRGSVCLDGEELSAFSRKRLAAKAALLGQLHEPCFSYTVRDTIALGRYVHAKGLLKTLSVYDEEVIADCIARLELDALSNCRIDELSGGQLQRVFLGRALAQTPDLILLDEPTNHLDLKHQLELLNFIKTWTKERGKTAVAVLHDLNLVRFYADRVLVMHKGRAAAYGTPAEALEETALNAVYEIDVRRFMLESLGKWQESGADGGWDN